MASIELPRSLSPEAIEAISRWFDQHVGQKRSAVATVLDDEHDLVQTVIRNETPEKKVIEVTPKPTSKI